VTVGNANVGVVVIVGVNVMVGVKVIVGVLIEVNVASGVKVNVGVCVSVGGAGVGVTACEGKLHAKIARTETKTAKYFLLI
jgi:hypothetical protein